jgi:hypothetical protein
MKDGFLCNVHLRPVGDLLLEVAGHLDHISFSHVFRELNQEADRLSKERQHLNDGSIFFKEVNDGVSVVTISST